MLRHAQSGFGPDKGTLPYFGSQIVAIQNDSLRIPTSQAQGDVGRCEPQVNAIEIVCAVGDEDSSAGQWSAAECAVMVSADSRFWREAPIAPSHVVISVNTRTSPKNLGCLCTFMHVGPLPRRPLLPRRDLDGGRKGVRPIQKH
jgi:hypothetical protein